MTKLAGLHSNRDRKLPAKLPGHESNILVAENIFGPDVGSLKGKTTRKNPHAVKQVVEPLEPSVMRHYRCVTLCADVMFVNSIPFLVTVSWHIKFGTIQPIANWKLATIMAGMKAVLQVYRRAGFVVTHALMDGEFELLRGELAECKVALNITAQEEHVGDIE